MKIYIAFPDKASLIADLESLSQQFDTVEDDFVVTDEDGNKVINAYTHHWAIHYIGRQVKTKADVDEEGNIITPATFWDGERANMVLISEPVQAKFQELMEAGKLNNLPNGTHFVNPVTPEVEFV